jgi:hexulose-6-phosphate isomerase
VRCEDALLHAYRAFRELAYAAEARNVQIAVENAWTRFLLSPVELRELIDHVNSVWIRVCLNIGHTLALGYPQDWIDTLGPRIVTVRASDYRLAAGTPAGLCLPGDGDVEWPVVIAALRQCHYAGLVTSQGPGDPADIAQRLDRILVG